MDYTIDDLLAELPNRDPRIDFRQRVDYSQVGIALLGEVVRRASGKSWPEFVQGRILAPLGMNSSYPGTHAFLRAHPDPAGVHNLMGRAVRDENGKLVDGPWKGAGQIYTAAAGMITTGHDMTRLMLFLLNGGIAQGHAWQWQTQSVRPLSTRNSGTYPI